MQKKLDSNRYNLLIQRQTQKNCDVVTDLLSDFETIDCDDGWRDI